MLHEQIRHAAAIRKTYRMKHLLVKHNIESRFDYFNSKQFNDIKPLLEKENIINKNGMFVESLPNMHLVIMPLIVDKEQIKILGNKIPYTLFLALLVNGQKTISSLVKECDFDAKNIDDSLKLMADAGMIKMDKNIVKAVKNSSAGAWFLRYLNDIKSWVYVSDDISVLFRAIPSYVGGVMAQQMFNYEPGLPLPRLKILTQKPFLKLVESIIKDSRHKNNSRNIDVELGNNDETEWIDDIPYQKQAQY